MKSFVGVENRPLKAGEVAIRCGRALNGGERALPNAAPRPGVAAAGTGGRMIRIAWSPAVAWCKQVELSRR